MDSNRTYGDWVGQTWDQLHLGFSQEPWDFFKRNIKTLDLETYIYFLNSRMSLPLVKYKHFLMDV